MQMLQSDWLSYIVCTRILSAIRVQWLPVVHEIRCFYSFSNVLEGILDRNFRCKQVIKFLRRLKKAHLRFVDFKNLKILKKRVHG